MSCSAGWDALQTQRTTITLLHSPAVLTAGTSAYLWSALGWLEPLSRLLEFSKRPAEIAQVMCRLTLRSHPTLRIAQCRSWEHCCIMAAASCVSCPQLRPLQQCIVAELSIRCGSFEIVSEIGAGDSRQAQRGLFCPICRACSFTTSHSLDRPVEGLENSRSWLDKVPQLAPCRPSISSPFIEGSAW